MWNTKTMLSRYKYKTQWMNAIRKQKGWTEEIESGIDFAKGIPILFFKCLGSGGGKWWYIKKFPFSFIINTFLFRDYDSNFYFCLRI